jgi:DNA-binding SARP family transcriptional activator/tetratricopeptide (TPR) repeat protein
MYGIFWPESDEEHARHSLRQALYSLRQELGDDVVQAEAVLVLDRARLGSDVGEFRAAVASSDLARAVQLASGPFLDGFFLAGAGGFERWVEDERAALAADAGRALLALAREAGAGGDLDAAADWWQRLTRLDPLSGRFALGFLKALAARGDRAGALAFARAHESLIRRELEADPDPEIQRLEAELRAMPPLAVVPRTLVRATPGRPADAAPGPRPPNELSAAGAPQSPVGVQPTAWRTRRWLAGAVAAITIIIAAALATADRWFSAAGRRAPTTFAVGLIREEGIPDTLRIGGVLTDMLATNLARVAGLSVLSNVRLLELMRPGQDTLAVGYVDAARRAGAVEIFQGRLLAGPQWSLAMEIQRVEVATGIVRGAYRVHANDRYALVDSATAAITHDLRLQSPAGSIAEATTASPIAYRLYEEGLRALYQYDFEAAIRLFSAALQEDSTFAMAAYYDAVVRPGGDSGETARRSRVLRLASRLPERERLSITARMLDGNQDPAAFAVAETLSIRYPSEPQSHERLAMARLARGEFAAARDAIERAIALDSAAEPEDRQACRLCEDFPLLAQIYMWWDSIPAADRTAQRLLRLRPSSHYAWHILALNSAALGDTTALEVYLRKFRLANPAGVSQDYSPRHYILAERYDEAERRLLPLLESPLPGEAGNGRWLKSILLRNQGRVQEARRLARGDPDDLLGAIAALEAGDSHAAVATLERRANWDESLWAPGVQARHHAWNHTLLAMAVAASGDTIRLRRLADTVEFWGQRSNYGRDRRAHHYVRGMLLIAEGRDAEAVGELREAIHSPTNGFTRVNYELGKALLRLNRPAEAIPVVRAGLHGDIDGSNLYVTRTELHEVLAQAFDQSGSIDSAAVHYRAVVRAWDRADPRYQARRDRARAWLARHASQADAQLSPAR